MKKASSSFLTPQKKLLLGAFIVAAAVCLLFGNSFLNLIHNKLEFKRLTKFSTQLDKEHEQLQKQLELLKNQDTEYMERTARVKYHMSKPGEIEFRFKNK